MSDVEMETLEADKETQERLSSLLKSIKRKVCI